MRRSFAMFLPVLALVGGVAAPAAEATTRLPAPAFLALGRETDPPRGFIDMCATGDAACPGGAALPADAPRLVSATDFITGALASVPPAGSAPPAPRAPGLCLVGDAPATQAVQRFGLAVDMPPADAFAAAFVAPAVAWSVAADAFAPPAIVALPPCTMRPAPMPEPAPVQSLPAATARPVLDKAAMAQLKRVDRYVNRHVRQETDAEIFGRDEVWRRSGTGRDARGDCEDMAIEKRLELIDQGFDPARLFLAVVYLHEVGLHTVLVARLADGDYVLDSRSPYVSRWSATGYSWLSVQDGAHPARWYQPGAPDRAPAPGTV